MKRANLLLYSVWQLHDYVIERGALSLIIGIVTGLPLVFAVRGMGAGGAAPLQVEYTASRMASGVAATLGVLVVLLTVQRMVSGDRTAGYFRFYFSKPLRPWMFYLQRYVLYGVGLLLAVVALLAIAAVERVHVNALGALLYFLILYVAMGGLGFLCSAITRYDWSLLAVVWFGSMLMRTLFVDGTGWKHWVAAVLPRAETVDNVRDALFQSRLPDVSDVSWLVGYGVACVVLGLIVIRRRPLAS